MRRWIFLALIVCLITGFEAANMKFISKNCNKSEDLSIILSLCFIIAGLFSFIYLIYKRDKLKKIDFNRNIILGILIFGTLIVMGRYFFVNTVKLSPNMGYSHMIINMNVILSLILAYFLFGQMINRNAFFGILICLIGVYIIVKSC